jgi:phosphate acyltransferase
MDVRIAVDLFGGDVGSAVCLPGCINALRRDKRLKITALVSRFADIGRLKKIDRLDYAYADSIVDMDENPLKVMRNKLNSTIGCGLGLVKNSAVDAFLTAGNTGALIALGHRILGAEEKKYRSAIMTTLPSKERDVYLLDSGANTDCSADMLYQFACHAVNYFGVNKKPSVGILNIGHEPSKGTLLVQEAAKLIQSNPSINYYGFIEPADVFKGEVDIVVCDGFSGNIFLKTVEATSEYVMHKQVKMFNQSFLTRLMLGYFKSAINKIKQRYSRSKYTYGVVLGLKGQVYKAHGSVKQSVFTESILHIADHIRQSKII